MTTTAQQRQASHDDSRGETADDRACQYAAANRAYAAAYRADAAHTGLKATTRRR